MPKSLRLFLVTLALSGCAVAPLQGDIDQRVDTLLSEEEYGRAMDTLAFVPDAHPRRDHFARRLQEVRKLSDQYAGRVMAKADALVREGQWGDALQLYRDALHRMPRHPGLRDHLKQFRAKQAERVAALELEQLIAQGKWLRTALSLQESITQVAPESWSYNSDLDDLRDEAGEIAERLTERGLAAMEAQDLGTAGRTLPLAAELKPSPRIERAEKQLSLAEAHQIRHQRQARERARKLEQERQAGALRVSFEQARAKGDLVRARELLNQLLALAGDSADNRRLGESFQQQLNNVVQQTLDEGAVLYSRGLIEEAMVRWQHVLDLSPDHEEARANLERAERVADRLQQLREKQTVPTAGPVR